MPIDLSGVNAPTVGFGFKFRRYLRLWTGRDRQMRADARAFEEDQRLGRKVRRPAQDHYDETNDVRAFYKAQADFQGSKNRPITSSRLRLTLPAVQNILRADKSVKTVIDFGCHYGWLANEIAAEFPNVTVISTDRHEKMLALNRAEFPRPNIEFPAVPDMAEYIRTSPDLFRGALFTHTYTTMFLMPEAIREIYAELYRAGTKYIVAHEQLGFSRYSMKQIQFSYEPQPSMWQRDDILLHNYPEILQAAGFELTSATAHRVKVVQPDHRSAIFVAKAASGLRAG